MMFFFILFIVLLLCLVACDPMLRKRELAVVLSLVCNMCADRRILFTLPLGVVADVF